jgi:hypothetical protein
MTRKAAIIETAENARRAHPEWSWRRCLREAIRVVNKLEAMIDAGFATNH